MKKIVTLLLILAIHTIASSALAWTKIGLNFRQTAAYVTDGADEAAVLWTGSTIDVYPTTRGGATFGWSTNVNDTTRDRNDAYDRRLAGIHQQANSTGAQRTFYLDLPSTGTYKICLAAGQAWYASAYTRIDIIDNVTTKFSMIDSDGIADNTFDDANGTNHTAANWPANNTCRTGVSFSSTTLTMKLGATSVQSGDSVIAHLYVEKEVSATGGFSTLQQLGY